MPRVRLGAATPSGALGTLTGEAPEAPRHRPAGLAPIAAPRPAAPATRRVFGGVARPELPVVLGTSALASRVGEEAAVAVLDRFAARGGDTLASPASAGGADQEILGRWMRGRRARARTTVVLRVDAVVEATPRALVGEVEAAVRRLRTDHVDVLAVRPDAAGRLDELLSAVEVLLARGLVRGVIASGFSAEQLFEARVLAALGLPRLGGAEVRYNLLEREHAEGDLGLVAAGQGLPLVTLAPLAHGFLAGSVRRRGRRHRADVHEGELAAQHLHRRGLRMLAALDAIGGELGAVPAAVAVAWLLTRPHVAASVVDAASEDAVDAVAGAAALVLDEHHLAALDRARR